MRRIVRLAPLAALALFAGTARAAAPAPYLSYSGYLLDGAGQPVTSLSTLQFNFYTTAGGTTPVYSDSLTVTPSSDGYFTAIIGVNTALDPATFKVALWMGIKVNTDPVEMSPRVQLTSGPYSLTADWQYLTNVPATFTPSSHTHSGSDITSAVANALAVPWTGITGTIFGGTGTASTAAHSDHDHNGTYAQLAAFNALATPGTINTAGNPVDWTKLKGVPAGFADGVDDTGLASVTTDASLSGAGTGASPLAVNPANVQSRVGQSCGGNTFIQSVNQNGTVNCGTGNTGTVTSVAAAPTPGNPIVIGGTLAAPTIDITKATASTGGYLSGADWSAFAAKGNGTVTSVGTGAGLTGGPISGTGTISIVAGGVTNAMLANSTVGVTTTAPLTGGGTVALGSTTTLGLGTVPIANGGTGLTSGPAAAGQYLKGNGAGGWAIGAIAASDLPATYVDVSTVQTIGGTKTFTNPIGGSITGNAATVTSGLYSTGSYADPAWLTSVGGAKVSGNIPGNSSGFTGSLAGDVTGTQAATSVVRVQGRPVAATAPTIGQALVWTGTQWLPTTVLAGPSIGFAANMATDQNVPFNVQQVLPFSTENYDASGNYDPATATFTAPENGFYHFDCTFVFTTAISGGSFRIYMNSDLVQRNPPVAAFEHVGMTIDKYYPAGSTVTCQLYNATASGVIVSSAFSRFSGFKIH
jgi:hypothetical protein